MPISYQIDGALGLVVTRFRGTVTDEELATHIRMLADDESAAHCNELVVFDRSALSLASGAAVRAAAQHIRDHGVRGDKKLAIVAPSNIAFGLARLFVAHRSDESLPTRIEVFRSLAPALAWLDLPADLEP